MTKYVQRTPEGEILQICELPHTYTFKYSEAIGIENGSRTGAFHLSDSDVLLSEGFRPLIEEIPTYNSSTEFLEGGEPEISADGLSESRKWTVVPKTAEQLEAERIQAWDSIRNTRNQLLAQSDWTQLADVPSNPAWIDYRQALRDITDMFDTPEAVIWPEKPE